MISIIGNRSLSLWNTIGCRIQEVLYLQPTEILLLKEDHVHIMHLRHSAIKASLGHPIGPIGFWPEGCLSQFFRQRLLFVIPTISSCGGTKPCLVVYSFGHQTIRVNVYSFTTLLRLLCLDPHLNANYQDFMADQTRYDWSDRSDRQ